MKLKTNIKGIIKHFLQCPIRILLRVRILTPKVVVRMDGGICSQMHFYLIGQLFKEKGYHVEYDLSWFKEGKDLTGRFERNFDLLKMFPDIDFKKASYLTKEIYAFLFRHQNDYFSDKTPPLSYLELVPPVYLSGYYKDPLSLYTNGFKQYFYVKETVLDEKNRLLLAEIQKRENSVAIHVRRGDLSQYLEAYGQPASIQYFQEAVSYFNQKYSGCFYFIFSDEPKWCETYLVHHLPIGPNFQIVNINGSDKGYMDLILISKCRHQIASKGSLGKYGALLSAGTGEVAICNDATEKEWKKRLENTIYFTL